MGSAEGMDLAKMAVTVLLVVLVIGAVVALVYKAYSWFTSGSDKLGDTVTSIDSSAYANYDDNVVVGTDVLTALKSFRDSDVAIVICNKNNGGYTATPANAKGTNYCGLATGADASTFELEVKYNNNRYEVDSMQWNASTGLTIRNTNFSPTTNKGDAAHYVNQSTQWYGSLIYDVTTNEVSGILFREMTGAASPTP